MDGVSTYRPIDRSKSIEDLDAIVWPPPALDSYVARKGFNLRMKPLASLTDEDLRVGLEQQIGLDYLVPIALERLDTAPLVEARLYPGDLLDGLLNVPATFWDRNPGLRHLADAIAGRAFSAAPARPETWQVSVLPGLEESYARFGGKLPSRRWLRPNESRAAPPAPSP
jgi:hypothetical protein